MAEVVNLVTQPREGRGSQKAKHVRRKGLIPAVVYGHKEATLSIALPAEELLKAVRSGSHIVNLQTDGTTQTALIKETQWDHLGKELLHVDFARVSADERVTVSVPLEVRGTAPGIAQGGVLDQPLHTLKVECPVVSIPPSIRVNVGELLLGSAIHVRELTLPEGVKAMDDPDVIVVHVTAKIVEAEPTVAAATPTEGEKAEPEVVARGKPKAEGEEAEGEK